MLEQHEHFKHLSENPTYFRPEDWGDLDNLIDGIIDKNKAGYQMVNSVQRLEEMKTFVRMSSGLNIRLVRRPQWIRANVRDAEEGPRDRARRGRRSRVSANGTVAPVKTT